MLLRAPAEPLAGVPRRALDPETFVDPKTAAEYLKTRHGFRASRSTLAKHRCDGTGPRFDEPGCTNVAYKVADLDAWAVRQRGAALTSTAEARSSPPAATAA